MGKLYGLDFRTLPVMSLAFCEYSVVVIEYYTETLGGSVSSSSKSRYSRSDLWPA